jgi:hypothetical protein
MRLLLTCLVWILTGKDCGCLFLIGICIYTVLTCIAIREGIRFRVKSANRSFLDSYVKNTQHLQKCCAVAFIKIKKDNLKM